MRSIAHGEAEKVENKATIIPINFAGSSNDETSDIKDETADAETRLMAAEHANSCVSMHTAILALFEDDPVAKLVLEGVMEELTMDEMRELTGLDKVAYASKRKLIRRRIDKQYPEGWKP